ncbi:MAG TPA: VWA domain-containing protein [Bryobacterales bacterium]|nr:VWA domain-containing protein [Bryobacterales bacterium]
MKAVSLALLSLLPVLAQAPKPPVPGAPDSKIVVEVPRVPLLFTVSDKKGRFITDLQQKDFTIRDDKKPQTILAFARESDLPLRIGILIDTSNSVRERLRFEQEAAVQFVKSVLREPQDKAFLVRFDTAAELVVDFTSDPEKLAKGIRDQRAGGGTALYDAIYFSCRDKLPEDSPPEQFRRALVILSDGEDNLSHMSREQALEMAHKAEAVIFTISTNRSGSALDGDKVLKRFSQQTGGLDFQPFQAADLGQSFENIANELRHQYFILYAPNPFVPDGSFHTVEIQASNRALRVRARKGYYAPER